MIATDAPAATEIGWRELLPAGRSFLALPSAQQPVLVAERDPGVLRYVRDRLLAAPPGSGVPAGAVALARTALRLPGAWALARSLTGAGGAGDWLVADGHRLLLLNHSRDADRRLVALLFPDGGCEPELAVKIACCPAAATRIEQERHRLLLLAQAPLAAVQDTLPLVLPSPRPSIPALVTTAASGSPMIVGYYRGRHTRSPAAVRADFALAGRWLAKLQAGCSPGRATAPLELPAGLAAAAAAQLADDPAAARGAFDALDVLQRRLRAYQTVRAPVHGDFWAGNILVRDGQVSGVVDWERFEPAGNPVRDLARLAVAYSSYLDRRVPNGRRVPGHPGLIAGRPGGGVRYAIDGVGWYPRVVRAYLAAGLHRLGLPAKLGPDLLRAEVAAIAAEATDPGFGREQWRAFVALSRDLR